MGCNRQINCFARGHWGLNNILHGHNSEADKTDKKKSRDDHRNHAVDAIVVGMTSRSLLQKISNAAKKAEAKQEHNGVSDTPQQNIFKQHSQPHEKLTSTV